MPLNTPYEQPSLNYATCPPLNLHHKQLTLKDKNYNNFDMKPSMKESALYKSTYSIRTSILHYDWNDAKINNGENEKTNKKSKEVRRHSSCGFNKTIMQRSLPIFEVLPVFTTKDRYKSHQHFKYNGNSREYLKFFQIVKRKRKSSDSDIIFGTSKKSLSVKCSWEKSRIDWLMKLERLQEGQSNRKKHSLIIDACEEDVNIICCFPFINLFKSNPAIDS